MYHVALSPRRASALMPASAWALTVFCSAVWSAPSAP